MHLDLCSERRLVEIAVLPAKHHSYTKLPTISRPQNMDNDGFRIVPNVDYTKVGPLSHKRTLAFLNHFVTHTVRFLNRFSCVCEEVLERISDDRRVCNWFAFSLAAYFYQPIKLRTNYKQGITSQLVRLLIGWAGNHSAKLSTLSGRIQRIEIMMSILEAKLSSIPGLEDVTAPQSSATPSTTTPSAPTPPVESTPAPAEASGPPPSEPEPEPEPAAHPTMTVAQDPRYAKYFQMVKVGVPPGALRGKMMAEGLDPNLLDNPDAPVPDGGPLPPQKDSDDEMSSASSFSDDD